MAGVAAGLPRGCSVVQWKASLFAHEPDSAASHGWNWRRCCSICPVLAHAVVTRGCGEQRPLSADITHGTYFMLVPTSQQAAIASCVCSQCSLFFQTPMCSQVKGLTEAWLLASVRITAAAVLAGPAGRTD